MTKLGSQQGCLLVGWTTGKAVVEYDSDEPIALTMTVDIDDNSESVTWHFARETLDQALLFPGRQAGMGDLIVEVIDPSIIRFLVAGMGGEWGSILMDPGPLYDLMVRSFLLVPAQYERADVDGAIANILDIA